VEPADVESLQVDGGGGHQHGKVALRHQRQLVVGAGNFVILFRALFHDVGHREIALNYLRVLDQGPVQIAGADFSRVLP
jgi:hypothetical protein